MKERELLLKFAKQVREEYHYNPRTMTLTRMVNNFLELAKDDADLESLNEYFDRIVGFIFGLRCVGEIDVTLENDLFNALLTIYCKNCEL